MPDGRFGPYDSEHTRKRIMKLLPHVRPALVPSARRVGLLTAWLLIAAAASRGSAANLQVEIDSAIKSASLGEVDIAVSVRDAESERLLVEINADKPLIVASNMKLLTTGAALHVLGADFQFRTKMLWDGDRLTILGDGDPAFGDPELLELMHAGDNPGLSIEQFIELWIDAVTSAGITSIDQLIIDDRIFDRQYFHPGWPADQLNRRYCAEVAGFNVHLNVLHVFPAPRSGARPEIRAVLPDAPWVTFHNRATSHTGPDESNTAWISRPADDNTMTLYGNVRFAYQIPVPVTIHDPPQFFADLMAHRLRRAGVKVSAARPAAVDDAPAVGDILGPVVATPMTTILARCNQDSVNLYAEALLKRVGHELTNQPGSWAHGSSVMRHVVLDRLREPSFVASLIVTDGSGLSRDNRVTAKTLTAWLCSFHNDDELGPAFLQSLAEAGANGTLTKRFRHTELHGATVRGKTGYIDEVSTMSGYVIMPDGRCRTFSILVNGFKRGELWRAKDMQERIVGLIAEDLATSVSITLGSD